MKKETKGQKKIHTVLHEFKEGELRAGKRGPGKGPIVKSRRRAVAIALSEARRVGARIPRKSNKGR